jgi:hypothetical protein
MPEDEATELEEAVCEAMQVVTLADTVLGANCKGLSRSRCVPRPEDYAGQHTYCIYDHGFAQLDENVSTMDRANHYSALSHERDHSGRSNDSKRRRKMRFDWGRRRDDAFKNALPDPWP